MAFFEYRYQGSAVSFGGALGDAFAESVRRTAGSPRFRGWRVRSASVSVEHVDGSDLVRVYGFDAPEDCPLGVHDLAVASSACYG